MERYDSVQTSIDEVAGQIADREAKAIRLTEFAKELKERDSLITEFDSRLWGSLVESVTIGKDKEMMFRFRDGTEVIV